MAEILFIAAAVLAIVLVVVAIALLWRPSYGDDGDRFSNARRITTRWAADAGTDLAHPAPGQPGTVDTSPQGHLTSDPGPSGEVVNIRPEIQDRPARRQGRAQ